MVGVISPCALVFAKNLFSQSSFGSAEDNGFSGSPLSIIAVVEPADHFFNLHRFSIRSVDDVDAFLSGVIHVLSDESTGMAVITVGDAKEDFSSAIVDFACTQPAMNVLAIDNAEPEHTFAVAIGVLSISAFFQHAVIGAATKFREGAVLVAHHAHVLFFLMDGGIE